MCSDAAGLARLRTRTYEKRRKKKNVPFFDEGRDALRAVLWAVGPAPRARAFKRKNSRKRKFMESYQGRQPSYMRRLSEKREKRKEKIQTEKEKLAGLFR